MYRKPLKSPSLTPSSSSPTLPNGTDPLPCTLVSRLFLHFTKRPVIFLDLVTPPTPSKSFLSLRRSTLLLEAKTSLTRRFSPSFLTKLLETFPLWLPSLVVSSLKKSSRLVPPNSTPCNKTCTLTHSSLSLLPFLLRLTSSLLDLDTTGKSPSSVRPFRKRFPTLASSLSVRVLSVVRC